jgi:hypothetical protein
MEQSVENCTQGRSMIGRLLRNFPASGSAPMPRNPESAMANSTSNSTASARHSRFDRATIAAEMALDAGDLLLADPDHSKHDGLAFTRASPRSLQREVIALWQFQRSS